MKKAIVVFGNIASGKSTFCEYLLRLLKDDQYKWFSIDHYRAAVTGRPNMHDFVRELEAKKMYMADLDRCEKAIIETTACSKLWDDTHFKLKSYRVDTIFVRIECPLGLCYERYIARSYERMRKGIPEYKPPYPKNVTPVQSIEYIHWHRRPIEPDIVLDSGTLLTVYDMADKFIDRLCDLKRGL